MERKKKIVSKQKSHVLVMVLTIINKRESLELVIMDWRTFCISF